MTNHKAPQYWQGWDQLEQKLADLNQRLETMNDRWRWGVRMEIDRVSQMLEARSRNEHYVLVRQEDWLPGEKRCVCGLQIFDSPEYHPFPKVPGHIDWTAKI